jgi:cholesterol transport system auxiliary component
MKLHTDSVASNAIISIANYADNSTAKLQFPSITWLIALVCGLLSACTALPQAPVSKSVYDFGPAHTQAPVAVIVQGGALNTKPLLLAEVEATPALDSTAMLYRLGYANAQQLQPYAQARWSMTPAQLLQLRMRQALGQTRPVLSPGDSGAAYVLRMELEEFHQSFESPQKSEALVRLRATVSRAGGQLLTQRSFSTRSPARSPDAAGGAQAMAAASDEAVAQVIEWMDTQPFVTP